MYDFWVGFRVIRQDHDAGIAEGAHVAGEVKNYFRTLRHGTGNARLVRDGHIGLAGEHGGDFGSRIHLQNFGVNFGLQAVVFQHFFRDREIGIGFRRRNNRQTFEFLRILDDIQVLRHTEIVGPLNHGADHNAGAALLSGHLHHGGVANGKLR